MSITKCGNLSIGKSIFSIISAAGLKKEYKHGSFFRAVERRDETLSRFVLLFTSATISFSLILGLSKSKVFQQVLKV